MTEAVDLRVLTPHVMTTAWHEARQNTLLAMLTQCGMATPHFHYSQQCPTYWEGLARIHLEALQENSVPLLVLEDDASLFNDHFQPVIEIPPETDVLFLGGSCGTERYYGPCDDKYGIGTLVFDEITADYVRIYNMHSTTAVLYVSEAGRQFFAAGLLAARFREAIDITFGKIMGYCHTRLQRKPFWHQVTDEKSRMLTSIVIDHRLEDAIERQRHDQEESDAGGETSAEDTQEDTEGAGDRPDRHAVHAAALRPAGP